MDPIAPYQRGILLGNQQGAAKQYEDESRKHVEANYESMKAPIEQSYGSARRNLMGDLNRRGMLKSGMAGTKRAQLDAEEYGAKAGARTDAVRGVDDRLLAMQTDPLQSFANINEQNQSYNQQLRDIESQRQQFLNQLYGQSASYVGAGLGSGAANLNANQNFFHNPRGVR